MPKYKVLVDDNFHFMDKDERYQLGVYATAEEAVAACKRIVDDDLRGYCASNPGITADGLYDLYVSFGDDPFIVASESSDPVEFSAWEYAKEQSRLLGAASGRPEKTIPSSDRERFNESLTPPNDFKGGHIVMLGGDTVYNQWSDIRRRQALKRLQSGELPLDDVTAQEEGWLSTALSCLTQIHAKRAKGSPDKSAFCIFVVGNAYVQFLAPAEGRLLVCEAASAQSVPQLGEILNANGKNALQELGFSPPQVSPNYSQHLEIESDGDLAYAARLALRVFRQVYRVQDMPTGTFKLVIPEF